MSANGPMWNPEIETLSREEMKRLQLQRLQEVVQRVYHKVPFYQRKFDERGIKPDDIKHFEDLYKLPFTSKLDFRENYPFGLFTLSPEDCFRLQASSGTTGKPVVGGYTKHDMDVWAEAMARCLIGAGMTSKDILQNSFGYGLFTGGLGLHIGGETIGATVLPTSGGFSNRQVMLMEDLGCTALSCTPSYAMVLVEAAEDMHIDIKSRMKLRLGVFGAEPWTEQMRNELERRWHIQAINIYGLTEIIGPGVSCECTHKNGMHVQEDHFLAEIIDPVTGEPLGYGREGELVFTTVTKQAMPVIRFRTRDRCTLYADKCACGRTTVRMGRITGRTDDMLIIRGVNIFPSQIEGVIMQNKELEPQYIIVVDRQKARLDELEVRVEATESAWAQGEEVCQTLGKRVAEGVQQIVGISIGVKVVPPKSIVRSEGKAKRVYDYREVFEPGQPKP
ncbi:MAG: phenylacetate--CoA ligase [Chloroflexi bacterium]|nr:phenylacetate--CoA ligase [Chloroflexota bacterium]